MRYSDELIQQAAAKGFSGLTLRDRQEIREALLYDEEQDRRLQEVTKDVVNSFKDDTFDPLDMPRHRWLGKNSRYEECPVCKRIRNYNTSYVSDYLDVTNHPEDFCKKPHIHNEKSFTMLFNHQNAQRDRVVIGG